MYVRVGAGWNFRKKRSFLGLVLVTVIGAAAVLSSTSSAQAASSKNDSLSGVSCAGALSCVAVGTYEKDNTQFQLAEHWNGRSWTLMNVPNSSNAYMSAVSCIAATTCWAVSDPGSGIEQLRGTTWTGVTAVGSLDLLYGISCTTPPEACSAVGTQYYEDGMSGAWAFQWVKPGVWGATGSVPPSTVDPTIEFVGVSCTSSSSCMTVGTEQYVVSFNNNDVVWGEEPIVETWNGSNWSELTAPSDGTDSGLTGVSCYTASDCMAVGYDGAAAFVEQWNGAEWSIAPSPSSAALTGVSCVSAHFCVAVGDGVLGRWNGTGWSKAGSPTGSGDYAGVSCTSASSCMAVGSADNLTLTARWNGTKWSTVSSPNR